MAKLELPVRAYLTDFCQRSFPEYDWSRGSGINDLVLKPLAVALQPLRHEIDVSKINSSILNYSAMRRSDLDALAANWGKFRQTGTRSTGTVRLYLSAAKDYYFNYLEFQSTDGTTFVLTSPITIVTQALLSQRTPDGLYYFDVAVQSVGIGSRYAVTAGSVTTAVNPPAELIRVENLEDFVVTAPAESNYDVVNSMFRNLGARNFVSPASIRAPLLDNFAGISDVFVAGADSPKMQRDILEYTLDGKTVSHHAGGMADIWVNTNSLVQHKVTFAYLPSSCRVKLVSLDQAATNEILSTFTSCLLDQDGRFGSAVALDESDAVLFNQAGVSFSMPVHNVAANKLYQLASSTRLRGESAFVLPYASTSQGNYLFDPLGLNFSSSGVIAGDYVTHNSVTSQIVNVDGRVIEPGTHPVYSGGFRWSSNGGNLHVAAGDTFVPYANSSITTINSRCIIPTGEAAGEYRVHAVTTSGIYVGNTVAGGTLANPTADFKTYVFADAKFPSNTIASNLWAIGDVVGNYGESGGAGWTRVKSIEPRALGGATVTFETPLFGSPSSEYVVFVSGLRGTLVDGDEVRFETVAAAPLTSSVRHSKVVYANQLSQYIEAGVTNFSSLGIAVDAVPGDLILFEGAGIVSESGLPSVGGDGSKFTVVVNTVTAPNTVSFAPLLPFDIPAGTRFSVLHTSDPLATLNVDSADSYIVKVDGWALGLGDGVGLVAYNDADGEYYTILASTAGSSRTLSFNAATSVVELTLQSAGYVSVATESIGAEVSQQTLGGQVTGRLVSYNNSTRVWTVAPNSDEDVFAVSSAYPIVIEGATSSGYISSIGAPYLTGYTSPIVSDLGKTVVQGDYRGTLQSYSGRTWHVTPATSDDVFDLLDVPVTIESGTGTGTLAQRTSVPSVAIDQPVYVSLDRVPAISGGDTLVIYPRFPITGGMYNGTSFHTSSLSDDLTDFAQAGDNVITLLGDNCGKYTIDAVDASFKITLNEEAQPEFVRVRNAPGPQTVTAGLTAGSTTLSFANAGVWGQPGRVIIVTVNGSKTYVTVDSPLTANSVQLEEEFPFTPQVGSVVTAEIVEGKYIPYFIVPPAQQTAFSIFHAPEVGEVLYSGTAGTTATHILTDNSVDFLTTIPFADVSQGDYQLFIDSGTNASLLPLTITGIGQHALTVSGTLSAATNIAYHVVFTNRAGNKERWIKGTVTDGVHVTLDVPDGWTSVRHGTDFGYAFLVASAKNTGPGVWAAPLAIGEYDSGTKTLTLNFDSDAVSYNTVVPNSDGFAVSYQTECRVMPVLLDHSAAQNIDGSAICTYNYYLQDFFSMPVVSINSVTVLNPQTLQPEGAVNYTLNVLDKGLRYSDIETNELQILDATAVGKPIQVVYTSDLSISGINAFLQNSDTRVMNSNQLAKRMETISVDLSLSVRSAETESALSQQLAAFLSGLKSTETLSKDKLIKYMYDNALVDYVDVSSIVLGGTYYTQEGTVVQYTDVNEIYGAETACYLARTINVTRLREST